LSKKKFSDFKLGDTFSKEFTISEKTVQDYAKTVGDFNPIHLDSTYASTTPFGERICHGTLLTGFVSAVLGMSFPGEGTILIELNSKFLAPVFVGEKVTINFEIIEKKDLKKQIRIEFSAVNMNSLIVFKGESRVKFD